MTETRTPTFANRCIISCGMLHPEISYLIEAGFLDALHVLFTPPGRHALPERAEEILDLFDWTGLEVRFRPTTLDRFKGLLAESAFRRARPQTA